MKAASSRKSKGTTFRAPDSDADQIAEAGSSGAAVVLNRPATSRSTSKTTPRSKAAASRAATTLEPAGSATGGKAGSERKATTRSSRSGATTRSASKSTTRAGQRSKAADDTVGLAELNDETTPADLTTIDEPSAADADALDRIPALDGDLDDEMVDGLDDEMDGTFADGLDELDDPDATIGDESLAGDLPGGLAGSGLTSTPRTRLTPSQLIAEHRVNSPLDRLELDQVWRMYRADPNTEVRNYLWQRYLPLVRYNAERVYSRLPDEVDLDNLIQAGSIGLMDAIRSFDIDRGVKFETFCAQRIRGAILDELRNMDWVPRLVRHRTSRVEQIRERMRAQHGIRPTSEEIARELGCDEEEVKKVLKDGHAVSMSSLSRQRFQSDGSREVREIDVIHDHRQSDPLQEVQRADLRAMLCKGLSRAERLIVVLYYYEGMTMKEIGMTLDLSESRVSQMHSLILLRLKAQMQHREGEFEHDD